MIIRSQRDFGNEMDASYLDLENPPLFLIPLIVVQIYKYIFSEIYF